MVLGTTTTKRTNLVDRKWLDNNFYGGTPALNYEPRDNDKLQATIGGAWNRYDGDHYGAISWAQVRFHRPAQQRGHQCGPQLPAGRGNQWVHLGQRQNQP